MKWQTAQQMLQEVGFYPGEWKLKSSMLVGNISTGVVGLLVATDKTRGLFLGNDGKNRIIHKGNFVQHYDIPEKEAK